MLHFKDWLEETNEGFIKNISMAGALGLSAIGCKDGQCDKPILSKPKAPHISANSTKTITIDDGREISIPDNEDTIKYLMDLKAINPSLPINKTIAYIRSRS